MNEASEETKEELQNTTKPHDAQQSPERNEKPLETPDVGIFSVNPMISNQGSSLEGFCATFKKAHATRNKSVREHEQEDKKKDNGVNECNGEKRLNWKFNECMTLLCSHALRCIDVIRHAGGQEAVYYLLLQSESLPQVPFRHFAKCILLLDTKGSGGASSYLPRPPSRL